MMERVEHVAGEFRKAAHSQMAATTQRTIRSVMVKEVVVKGYRSLSFKLRFSNLG